jgi:alanine dehydrogenase
LRTQPSSGAIDECEESAKHDAVGKNEAPFLEYQTEAEKEHGGKGILLGGVPGVPRAKVVVIGGGVVGVNAAKVAVGMGADVTIVDSSLERLEYLEKDIVRKQRRRFNALEEKVQ